MEKHGAELSENQYSFDSRIFLHPLEHLGVNGGVLRVLQTDKKWQALEGKRAGLVDIDKKLAVIVHPQSLNPDHLETELTLPHEKDLSGIVVLLGPVSDQDAIRDRLSGYQKPLAHGGLLFVIERISDREKTIRRITALKEAGFVYPAVTIGDGYILWHANKEKAGKRTPVNVWDSESGPLVKKIYEEMKQKYLDAGFSNVDGSAIVGQLSHSTYIPRDEEKLKLGNGFVVQVPCRCAVEHTLSGDWNISGPDRCDGQHAGLSDVIERFEKLTPYTRAEHVMPKKRSVQEERPPSERFIKKHGGCSGIVIEKAFELRPVHVRHKRLIRYQIDTYCTSCGDIFRELTRVVDVPV